ncbi:MAG TPA: metallophosphoesterase [Thermoleophilia bacterium]|nr:metallophosphoesterase [Thermoleophilia bacterium]
MAGRTFVVSDVHGFPELVENALDHGCFDSARDRLVFAGDVVDRGPRVERCFELLKELRATCLLGNHDVAIMMGYWIPGQDWESRVFREKLRELFLETGDDGATGSRWEAVLCVDGVIISHAGVAGPHEDSVVAQKGSMELVALAKGSERARPIGPRGGARDGLLGQARGPRSLRTPAVPELGMSAVAAFRSVPPDRGPFSAGRRTRR